MRGDSSLWLTFITLFHPSESIPSPPPLSEPLSMKGGIPASDTQGWLTGLDNMAVMVMTSLKGSHPIIF